MRVNDVKRYLLRYSTLIPGWHSNRKLVVFESDDWGSIRMPSNETYKKLIADGLPVQDNHYLKYDSLESENDLDALFNLLKGFSDINGNHPVFTAFTVTSNPDFEKIELSGFKNYVGELFTETYKRYPKHGQILKMWEHGRSEKLILPQFHGKEHLNVGRWMNALNVNGSVAKLAFQNKMFDLSFNPDLISSGSFMDALRYDDENQYANIQEGISEGLEQFTSVFGYSPRAFTAPRYTWDDKIEEFLARSGIDFISSRSYQSIPFGSDLNSFRRRIIFTGKKSKYGPTFLTRNVWFEPSSSENIDWVTNALSEIDIAFRWRKPAIICTHRVNFSGNISEENRKRSLGLLKMLIERLLITHPETEFLSSVDLGNEILKTQNPK